MEKVLPFERSYWIIPGKLLAGEYPASINESETQKKLDSLVTVGIKTVINLTEDNEKNRDGIKLYDYTSQLKSFGIETHRKPIKDISIPAKNEMDDIIDLIDSSLNENKPVYFHCWGGVGRTGTVLGCYLLHSQMATKTNVFDFITHLKRTTSISHRESPETEEQRKFILNYKLIGKKLSLEHFTGCLVGGAVGDALGAPIEFDSIKSIRAKYGNNGVSNYVEFDNNKGEFTDDTQMTLFSAEGLLRAYHRETIKGIGGALIAITHHSYLRWLYTQGIDVNKKNIPTGVYDIEKGWLLQNKILYKKRAPGNTIVSSLSSGYCGNIDRPINSSKGCGTIMKVSPVGLMFHGNNKQAFKTACDISAITHGHPTGYLSAGVLASIIADISNGLSLIQSIKNALIILKTWRNHEETQRAIEKALNLHQRLKDNKDEISAEHIESLGGAWVAEEALSISLFASLMFENEFKKGVLLSVNHSGDSDSTGAITGNILGLINGYNQIPFEWRRNLIGEEIVRQVGEDLYIKIKGDSFNTDNEWVEKYPGF